MKLSISEIEKGELLPETLELAVNLVKVNGYVLFEEVLPREKIAHLFSEYRSMLNEYVEAHREEIFGIEKGFNAGTNHIRLYLPFAEPFIDAMIIEHPIAMAVIDRILGEDCILSYFATNTSLPGGVKCQPVHSDLGAVFGNLYSQNLPITDVVLNIPLVDVNENNGPLEIWPGGTHLLPDCVNASPPLFNKDDLAQHMQSLKVFMPAGSIVIRDIRMWHRGTPNHSNEMRPNMALVYSHASKAHNAGTIQIPRDTYDSLSARARQLLRSEKIGYPAVAPSH